MSVLSTLGSLFTSSVGMFFRRDEFFDDEIAMTSRKRLTVGFFLLVVVLIFGTFILDAVVDSIFNSTFSLYSEDQVVFYRLQTLYSKNGLGLIAQLIFILAVIFILISLCYSVGFQLSYWWARLFGGEGDRLSHYQVFLTASLALNFILMIASPFALGFLNLYSQKSSVVILNIYLTETNMLSILRIIVIAYLLLIIYMVDVTYRASKQLYNFETPLANGGTAVLSLLLPIILVNTVFGGWLPLIQTAITGG